MLSYNPVIKLGFFSVWLGHQHRNFSAVDSAEAKYKLLKDLGLTATAADLQAVRVCELAPTQRANDGKEWRVVQYAAGEPVCDWFFFSEPDANQFLSDNLTHYAPPAPGVTFAVVKAVAA